MRWKNKLFKKSAVCFQTVFLCLKNIKLAKSLTINFLDYVLKFNDFIFTHPKGAYHEISPSTASAGQT